MVLVGELGIPMEEAFGEIGLAEALQVHGEERDIGQHIAVAKMVVELEAVEHPGSVVRTKDVIGEKVTVTVGHEATADAITE